MPEFAIVATHRLRPAQRQKWVELAMRNALQARSEPGCIQFDIVLVRDDPNIGMILERYIDEAAWKWHFQQPYCQDFMKAIEGMLTDRIRTLCDVVESRTERK